MREIKFRGKNSAGWVMGSLIVNPVYTAIIEIENPDDGTSVRHYVIPDTVCQFTGLKDHKGREIYEGDIVKVVSYGEESFHVVKYMVDEDYPAFDLDPVLGDGECNSLSYCLNDLDTRITVIGNIHDNPELLRLTKTGGFEK